VVEKGQSVEAAKTWIKNGGKAVQPWDDKGFKLPGGGPYHPAGIQNFLVGNAMIRKQPYGNYPAATNLMKAVYEGVQVPMDAALRIETPRDTPIFTTAPGATNQTLAAGVGSFNPNNLDVYDYYNQPGSVGYVAHPQYLAMRGAFIGRPSVRLIDAGLSETGANANYLVLGNVDMRSAVDQGSYTTKFRQNSINIEHDFSDRFSMSLLVGDSESTNENMGLLADFIRLDSGQGVAGNDYFVYDDRAGGDMPFIDFGFDVADPNNWDFVKGYSALRAFRTVTENGYQTAKADFRWDYNDYVTLRFGIGKRKFDFYYTRFERLVSDTMNPSLLEGVRSGLAQATTVADMGQTVSWGDGLNVPDGMPTSFFAPNLQAFQNRFGFDCDCINEWGDWRLSDLRNGGVNTFWVDEESLSYYGQMDFNLPLFAGTLRGNAGLRIPYRPGGGEDDQCRRGEPQQGQPPRRARRGFFRRVQPQEQADGGKVFPPGSGRGDPQQPGQDRQQDQGGKHPGFGEAHRRDAVAPSAV
jgi:hypothetical protein